LEYFIGLHYETRKLENHSLISGISGYFAQGELFAKCVLRQFLSSSPSPVSASSWSCVKNGGSAAACACTLHRLQERMPLAQFIDYGSALQAKRKPPAALERKFRRTAMECARTSS